MNPSFLLVSPAKTTDILDLAGNTIKSIKVIPNNIINK